MIKTPKTIPGIEEQIYAGFWIRLGAILLDFLFILPVTLLTLYLNSLSVYAYYFTIVPVMAFHFWYSIYLVQKNGGTPGKLACNIKIYRIDGNDVGWREALLRHSVSYVISFFSIGMMISSISQADPDHYESLGWLARSQYLMALSPLMFEVYRKLSMVWTYGELFVLLFNKRKRALHDYIAGTVIIRTKYIDHVRKAMEEYQLIEANSSIEQNLKST